MAADTRAIGGTVRRRWRRVVFSVFSVWAKRLCGPMASDHTGSVPVGAIIIGLRPGDQRDLDRIAERVGRPPKEVAGILLEQAIRRETWPDARPELTPASAGSPAGARPA